MTRQRGRVDALNLDGLSVILMFQHAFCCSHLFYVHRKARMKRDFLTGIVMCCLLGLVVQSARAIELPTLNWTERSDWVNVKTDVTPAAVGDGIADDTAAFQAAINQIKTQGLRVLYFPPGTYRITQIL